LRLRIADFGLARSSIRKITTRKEKWPEGSQSFRPFNFAIANLEVDHQPFRTLRLGAFARNQTTRASFSQRRQGAKFAEILLKAAQFPSAGRNGNQGFKSGPFCNPQSAILASSVILWSDHCGADRVTARASVISNLY